MISVNPVVVANPLYNKMDFVSSAVPELGRTQAEMKPRCVVQEGRYIHGDFAADLAAALRVGICKLAELKPHLSRFLEVRLRLYFEADDDPEKRCGVCARSIVLGQCTKCGLYLH